MINLRFDDELFNQILNEITQVYGSKNIVKILKLTLEKNSESRIGIRYLLKALNQFDSQINRNIFLFTGN